MCGKVFICVFAACGLLFSLSAEQVDTLELSTSVVHPITSRLGIATLIQLPVEPVATNVGDPAAWMVEKQERLVSIHPVQAGVRDTNLAIVTRQGTLNFSVHLASDAEPFTQMVRVTGIVDDSKPLSPTRSNSQEALTETIVREIRIAQNFYALKQVNSTELRDLEQVTQLSETVNKSHLCTVLQNFRFRGTRHLILHFIVENRSETPVTFEARRTVVGVGDTLFAPVAVSLGKNTLPSKASMENFILLDGSNGLSPRQEFHVFLAEISSSQSMPSPQPPGRQPRSHHDAD